MDYFQDEKYLSIWYLAFISPQIEIQKDRLVLYQLAQRFDIKVQDPKSMTFYFLTYFFTWL